MIFKRVILFLFSLSILLYGCSTKNILEEEKKDIKKLTGLYKDANWEKRQEAISKICAYKSPEVSDLLLTALNDSHSIIRIEAIKCLGSRKEKKAKKNIKKIAEYEDISNEKLAAIQALANYRDPTSAPVFAKGLDSEDLLIREESIKGLLMINDVFIQQVSIPYILEALKDPKVNVILAALENLRIKNDKIYTKLSEIINNEENYYKISLLKAALKAIDGYLLDEKIRERIIGFLTHPNKEIRILSLYILKSDNVLQVYEENE